MMRTSRIRPTRREILAGALSSWLPLPACAQGTTRRFETFLAGGADPATVDCGPAIVRAAQWSSEQRATVMFTGRILVATPAVIDRDNVDFQFDDARIEFADGGAKAELSNGSGLEVGVLFQGCVGLNLGGSVSFVPRRRSKATRLVGVAFDDCANVTAPVLMHFEDMAAGRAAFWCRNSDFGDITAARMIGRQSDSNATAGSADLVGACTASRFGRVTSRENLKPCRYLTAIPKQGVLRPNVDCTFGWVDGSPSLEPNGTSSPESSAIAIRSAVNCRFEGCHGRNLSVGINIVRYATDAGLAVEGNRIEAVTGDFAATSASVDGAVLQQSATDALPIGANWIGRAEVRCDGEFAIFVNSGRLDIDLVSVDSRIDASLVRPIVVENADLRLGRAYLAGARQEMIAVGQSASFSADRVEIGSGSFDGATGAIRYHPAFGHGGPPRSISIGELSYSHGGRGRDYQYILFDQDHRDGRWRIGNVLGKGARGAALLTRRAG